MSERQMTIVLLVVMGATLVLGGVALYWMRFVVLDDLEVQLADVNKKVAEAQAKKAAIKGLEEKVKSLKEEGSSGSASRSRLQPEGRVASSRTWSTCSARSAA
jgi:hypothetical protein